MVAVTDTLWSFTRSERTSQLVLEEEVYNVLKGQAAVRGLTFKDWAEEMLEEVKHSQ